MIIWLLLVVLLCCSGAISASETALFGLDQRALHTFKRSDRRLRRRVYSLMKYPHRVLMTVLIANTAVNVSIFAISFVALQASPAARPGMAIAGSVGVLFAVITFGEIVPKSLTLANARRFAPPAASLIAALQIVLAPLRWFLRIFLVNPLIRLLSPSSPRPAGVTTEELRLLVEHSASGGAIDSREHEMLQAVVSAGEVGVPEIMTHRVDLRWIPLDFSRQAALQTMRTSGLRKILVCVHDLDDVRGVLYARDLHLRPDEPLAALVKPVHFVPEQLNLVQLRRNFRRKGTDFAVVVDEYGGTAGSVSIEDVAEWIIGEIPDDEESGPEVSTERIDENTYRIAGNLGAHLWAERFAVRQIDRRVHTVGGLVLAKLGRLPRVGDSVRVGNLTLSVERMNKRRIERILLRRESSECSGECNSQ